VGAGAGERRGDTGARRGGAAEADRAHRGGRRRPRPHAGRAVGGGAEWAITPNWSIKGEYLHVDLGGSLLGAVNNVLVTGPAPFPIFVESQSYHSSFDVVRVGVNYRFGPVSPLAALARN
jgi:opacity protein-like surface antigen